MDHDQLRTECSRLFRCKTIEDSYDLIDIYINSLYQLIVKHHFDPVNSHADADARIVCQMMWTKTLHIKEVIKGIEYKADDGTQLNKIIDPTVVACLIRNFYETTSTFNLIYRNPKTPDQKAILYYLWVHAGLKFRERFESHITTDENTEKSKAEKAKMTEIVSLIKATDLYKQLSPKDQNKIHTQLKDRDYKIKFENNSVVFLSWQEITKVMEVDESLLGHIYTYFSLYSHPSNVAVFQFKDIYAKGKEHFREMTNFNLKTLFSFLSIFIADYINLFPQMLVTYDSLSTRDQIVINFHNIFIRNNSYSINDKINLLG